MAWLRRKSGGGSAVPARMPPAVDPGSTERFAERVRELSQAGRHGTLTQVFDYLELLRGRQDLPLFAGVSGRAAILLSLSGRMRANLDGLDELIRRKGARLYLQGHRLDRFGIVRAVLELPEYELIFEAPLTLADGDVQEFVSAAYQNEAVEVHLTHTSGTEPARFACRAAGIRPVVDAALEAVRGLDHPATHAEQATAADELEVRFPTVGDGLSGRTRVRLTVTGTPDGVVTMVARH
ncbi:hypothetical protein [Amycolatopsis sp. NPDC059021]|uniref:hypothetical protein n=1 Tax=Amycolatopsis sp. NPDC059021 TaxID=3346704 RepID=UPI00366D6358